MENTAKNKIITFYSFKGGAGRSQLLANLSAYICYHLKKRVLIIDWDLEAPGIDKFFTNSAFRRQDVNCGLIDLFKKYVQMVTNQPHTNNAPIEEKDLPTLRQTDNEKYIYNLLAYNGNAVVDFVPAVNYNQEGYSHVVNEFDWFNFYDQLQGRYFIEVFKQHLRTLPYDFVLIDSRTGISDYSGICNIQLPDINVLVTVPTAQSIEGTKTVAEKILASPYTEKTRPETVILPILSRVETSNNEGKKKWRIEFEEKFKEIIAKTLQHQHYTDTIDEYISKTTIAHDNQLAYGENLLFTPKQTIVQDSIEQIMLNILTYTEAKSEIDLQKDIKQFLLIIQENEKYQADSNFLSVFYRDLARLYYEAGEYKNALSYFEKSFRLVEGDSEDLRKMGFCYINVKDYSNARQVLQKSIIINGTNYKTWLNLGQIADELSEHTEAIKYYEKSIDIYQDNLIAWYNLGGVYFSILKYEEAVKCYQMAITIKADDADAWHNLGAVFYKMQNFEKAKNVFGKALELEPNNAIFWKSLYTLLFNNFEQTEAHELLERAVREVPNFVWAYKRYAFDMMNENREKEATDFLQEAVNQGNGSANMALGHLALQADNEMEAIALYQKSKPFFLDETVFKETLWQDLEEGFGWLGEEKIAEILGKV